MAGSAFLADFTNFWGSDSAQTQAKMEKTIQMNQN